MDTKTMDTQIQDHRLLRGQNMVENGFEPTVLSEGVFNVPSRTNEEIYTVMNSIDGWTCSCPDHFYRRVTCKHIYAIQFWLELRETMYHPDSEMMKSLEIPEVLEMPNTCVYCHSANLIKYGTRKTKMGHKTRYLCHVCGRTFSFEDGYTGFNNMKFSPEIITLSLDLFFKGTSTRKIADHLKQFKGIDTDHSTISKWLKKYTDIIEDYVSTLKPEVSNVWHTDEMQIKVKDGVRKQDGYKWNWLWNVMDSETRFLLTNLITKKRNIKEASKLFQRS
ncbi:MAG: transposase [Methanocellales archaeon]|nr:transposase [Methanocellales archaeon]MDD3291069.1 transposase [Methanocellales archaeon]MDD5234954.1 transposase [Methanocellales archaeon]MDD5484676.1 transposase [Methanocellales archaeon]